MKKIAIVTALLTLTGCISFPQSEQALAETGSKSPTMCSNQPVEKLTKDIEKYLSKCYRWRRDVYVNGANVTTNFYVSKKEIPEGAKYFVTLPHGEGSNFLLTVLAENGNSECQSTINGYAYNFMWARHFGKLEKIAKGEEASCPL
ncbi:hypothetical protein [Cellvibrio sp. pealriver]|uniref:hypothetical protein n=1 Tax=Cellvibrio sp. pealriver TaxID=1622269 RepID=UPI00066FC35C|nr:hypothetical protein [Cellvibrio sp. pealriver]